MARTTHWADKYDDLHTSAVERTVDPGPLMPDVYWAIGVLLLRFSISQMDVPTRQAYTMAVVRPDERSAAAGVTAVARSVGASISPMLATVLVGSVGLMSLPFFLAGGLKIVYDLLLYRAFANSEAEKKV
jgi:MFS family permease